MARNVILLYSQEVIQKELISMYEHQKKKKKQTSKQNKTKQKTKNKRHFLPKTSIFFFSETKHESPKLKKIRN